MPRSEPAITPDPMGPVVVRTGRGPRPGLRERFDERVAQIEGGVSERGGKHPNVFDRTATRRNARREQLRMTHRIPAQRHRTLEAGASTSSTLRDTDYLIATDSDLASGKASKTNN